MSLMNGTVIILGGSGGVGSVVTQMCSRIPVFQRIICASRDISKYEEINRLLAKPVEICHVDASDEQALVYLLEYYKPHLLINVGIPYWNLNAMSACLKTGVNYLDTACWEPPDEAHYRHDEQWNFHQAFKAADVMALIGCGYDPGVTNATVSYALRFFKIIQKIQIWDCNGGDHGKTFASNFNLAINLRELLGDVRYWLNGRWEYAPHLISELAIHHSYDFEEIGMRMLYLLYHEELESLAKNFPWIQEMSFWMTFGEQYLRCLRMFKEIGMTSIQKFQLPVKRISPMLFLVKYAIPDIRLIEKHRQLLDELGLISEQPIDIDGEISPLEFLQKILPEPSTLSQGYTGKTNISVLFEGIGLDGSPLRYRMRNILAHAECHKNFHAQGISTTTGIPAAIGAMLMMLGIWKKAGVYNVEQLNPIPFLRAVHSYGLRMQEQWNDEVPNMAV